CNWPTGPTFAVKCLANGQSSLILPVPARGVHALDARDAAALVRHHVGGPFVRLLPDSHRPTLHGLLQRRLVEGRQNAVGNQHQRRAELLEAGEMAAAPGGVVAELEPARAAALARYLRKALKPDEILVLVRDPHAVVACIIATDVVRGPEAHDAGFVAIGRRAFLQYQVFVVLQGHWLDVEDV